MSTQRRVAILVPLACLALIVALRLWLQWVGPIPGDRWALTRNDFGSQSRVMLDLGNLFQVIGTPVIATVTIVWAAVFVVRSDGLRGLAFLVVSSAGIVLNSVAKSISGPTPLMAERPLTALNFPSGHVEYAVVVFGCLAWLAWRHDRRDVAISLGILIAFMGPFRVTLGAHFVSDIIAGYLLGLAWLVPVGILFGYGSARPKPGV